MGVRIVVEELLGDLMLSSWSGERRETFAYVSSTFQLSFSTETLIVEPDQRKVVLASPVMLLLLPLLRLVVEPAAPSAVESP